MIDHYEVLGLTQDANADEIKKAYRRLVVTTHPDKVVGKEEEFKRIQEAYDTLSDPEKRQAYHASFNSLSDPSAHFTRLTRQGLKFYLVPSPDEYDLYTYFNALFNWTGTKALTVGQEIKGRDQDTYWEMLNFVGTRLYRLRNQLTAEKSKLTPEIKAKVELIALNEAKLSIINWVLLGCDKRKRLYDLAMGFTQDKELFEIEHLIGGKKELVQYIKKDKFIEIADGIFALYKAGLLNALNFSKLASLLSSFNVSSLSMILWCLLEVNLLTQTNFDKVIAQHQYGSTINKGLGRLQFANILNQRYFDAVVSAGKEAETLGCNLGALQVFGLLNNESLKVLLQKKLEKIIYPPLASLEKAGLLNQNTSAAMAWSPPAELDLLAHRINQMIAHGIYLLSEDVKKGKTALLLGLELRQELKSFSERSPVEQHNNLSHFKQSFQEKLHSTDKDMAIHRSEWKFIVANIALALTGIGLIALGIHYAINKQCFFSKTQREQMVEQIAHTQWLGSKNIRRSL